MHEEFMKISKISILLLFFTSAQILSSGSTQQEEHFSEISQPPANWRDSLEPEQQLDDYQEIVPFQENKYFLDQLNNVLITHCLTQDDRYILEITRDELEDHPEKEIPKQLIPLVHEIMLSPFQETIKNNNIVHGNALADHIKKLQKRNEIIRLYFATHDKLPINI